MRMTAFAKRCLKEILRDPLNLAFGLGFPVVLMLLLSAIQASVPVALFEIDTLSPGVTVFGLSFITLFSATLVARDRESSFLRRLYASPMKPVDFILGYTLPLLPVAVAQAAVCYLVALALGLGLTVNILYALLAVIPVAALYVALGVLCGSVFNVKQVGGVCGALLTNLSAWLSGVWFDISLVGGAFETLANFLPFLHAVELERGIVAGSFSIAFPHLYPVLIYAVAVTAVAVWCFLRQMKKQ